ncbi:MAG: NADP-dependent oxidoreductase, partial [Pseudolabrys sp.]
MLVKRARMQGFLVLDHMHRADEAIAQLADWVRVGKIRYREEILPGLEAAPDAIAGLYGGENF